MLFCSFAGLSGVVPLTWIRRLEAAKCHERKKVGRARKQLPPILAQKTKFGSIFVSIFNDGIHSSPCFLHCACRLPFTIFRSAFGAGMGRVFSLANELACICDSSLRILDNPSPSIFCSFCDNIKGDVPSKQEKFLAMGVMSSRRLI